MRDLNSSVSFLPIEILVCSSLEIDEKGLRVSQDSAHTWGRMDYKRIVTSDPSMTIQEKARRVLELYNWLKESKETDEAKAAFYAAKQAQKKYQMPFVEAYQYCVDSAECYDDELEAYISLVDIAGKLNLA